jgi:hypothetical protein
VVKEAIAGEYFWGHHPIDHKRPRDWWVGKVHIKWVNRFVRLSGYKSTGLAGYSVTFEKSTDWISLERGEIVRRGRAGWEEGLLEPWLPGAEWGVQRSDRDNYGKHVL